MSRVFVGSPRVLFIEPEIVGHVDEQHEEE